MKYIYSIFISQQENTLLKELPGVFFFLAFFKA